MSVQAISWAMNVSAGSPQRKLILLVLANYADPQGVCWPSYRDLAAQIEMSRRTVIRLVEELCRAGHLTKEERFDDDRRQKTNVFRLPMSGVTAAVPPSSPVCHPPSTAGVTPPVTTAVTPPVPIVSLLKEPSLDTSLDTTPLTPQGGNGRGEKRDEKEKTRDPSEPLGFSKFWAAYPQRDGNRDRKPAVKAFRAALKRTTFEAILAGAQAYAADMKARGKINTEYVKQARTWLNADGWTEHGRHQNAPISDERRAELEKRLYG